MCIVKLEEIIEALIGDFFAEAFCSLGIEGCVLQLDIVNLTCICEEAGNQKVKQLSRGKSRLAKLRQGNAKRG
jgi:hypothetical protein